MRKIFVRAPGGAYPIFIGAGILRTAGKLLRHVFPHRPRLAVIASSPVSRAWGKMLRASLKAAGFEFEFLEMPDGERHKHLAAVETLAVRMSKLAFDRQSVVVAFGGGVVGDVAGLLASIYMRGIDFVQIPTTLLAQVDASIGGKNGVNLSTGKNLVGTFHQPRIVLIDPAALSTLPTRELRAGLFESLKCGVIGDPKLFDALAASSSTRIRDNHELCEQIIYRSAALKAKIVSQDEKESGLRQVLNFGHTIGHALEAESGYKRFLHGEAVAWGMIAATRISVATNRIDLFSARRMIDAIHATGPVPAIKASGKKLLPLLYADKKNRDGRITFILPRKIGKVEIANDVPEAIIISAVDEMRESHSI